jgi:uncharacterized OB-fold protein
VAQALVRMAEAVASEVAEEQAVYRMLSQERLAIAFGKECECGRVYSDEHCFCSRCGKPLERSVVPKAIPGAGTEVPPASRHRAPRHRGAC